MEATTGVKTTVDFAKLFHMSCALKRGALHLSPVAAAEIEDWEIFLGERQIENPLEFHWHSGSRLVDCVGSTFVALKLISDRFAKILTEGQFTGWSTYPAHITGRDGAAIDGYLGFSVTGRCGPIDESRSLAAIRTRFPGAPSYKAMIGLYFDESSWDGSDIFVPEGTVITIVTEPVYAAIRQAKLSNIDFEGLTEYEHP